MFTVKKTSYIILLSALMLIAAPFMYANNDLKNLKLFFDEQTLLTIATSSASGFSGGKPVSVCDKNIPKVMQFSLLGPSASEYGPSENICFKEKSPSQIRVITFKGIYNMPSGPYVRNYSLGFQLLPGILVTCVITPNTPQVGLTCSNIKAYYDEKNVLRCQCAS